MRSVVLRVTDEDISPPNERMSSLSCTLVLARRPAVAILNPNNGLLGSLGGREERRIERKRSREREKVKEERQWN